MVDYDDDDDGDGYHYREYHSIRLVCLVLCATSTNFECAWKARGEEGGERVRG